MIYTQIESAQNTHRERDRKKIKERELMLWLNFEICY